MTCILSILSKTVRILAKRKTASSMCSQTYVIHRPRVVLNTEHTVFPNTYKPRQVNNIFSARKQGLGLTTNPFGFMDKMEKYRPMPEPIRLHDLQNSASHALRKKYKDVYHIVYRQSLSLAFVKLKPKINLLFYFIYIFIWLRHKPHQQERFNTQKIETESIHSPKRKVKDSAF